MAVPPGSPANLGRIARVLVVALMLTMAGCEDDQHTETAMFESAEVDFRQGNYEEALEGYQAFLEQYPQSPLASTAEMRLRSINREVSSVMERTGSPTPSYHGSTDQQSGTDAATPPPDSDSTSRPPTDGQSPGD